MITNKTSQTEEIDEQELIDCIEKTNMTDFRLSGLERKIKEFEQTVKGFSSSLNDAATTFKQTDSLTHIELNKTKNVIRSVEESVQKLDSDYCNLKYLMLFAGIMCIIFITTTALLLIYITTHRI